MKRIAKNSPACKSPSPTNTSCVNQTQNTAKVGGGRSLGRSGKKHSHPSERVKLPWQRVTESKIHASYPMATSIVDFPKGPTETSIIGHKRKLSIGEVTHEKMNKENAIFLNDPANWGNKENATNAQKKNVGPSTGWKNVVDHCPLGFDLNNPPIDDEGGEEHFPNGVSYESAMWPTRVKVEPFIEDYEVVEYPPPTKNVGSSSSIMIKLEPETSEMAFDVEENDAGGKARIPEFDLNEFPVDEDEE